MSVPFHFHKVSRYEDSLRRDGGKPHRGKPGHAQLSKLTAKSKSIIRVQAEFHFVLAGLGVKMGCRGGVFIETPRSRGRVEGPITNQDMWCPREEGQGPGWGYPLPPAYFVPSCFAWVGVHRSGEAPGRHS